MKRIRFLLMSGLLVFATAACDLISPSSPQAASTGPRAWIDTPLDGSAFPLAPLEIVSHSTDPASIAQVELSVNGSVVLNSPNPETSRRLVTMRQQWKPDAPGKYALQVRAQSTTGAWGNYAKAVITVGAWSSGVASSTPTAGPPAASPPAASIAFFADRITLMSGQCTMIYWDAKNVASVTLDGAAVASSGNKQDCLTKTTTHLLQAVALDRQVVSRSLTISVVSVSAVATDTPGRPPLVAVPTKTLTPLPRPPFVAVPTNTSLYVVPPFVANPSRTPTASPPTIGYATVNPSLFYPSNTGCSPNKTTISVGVSDVDGVASVIMYSGIRNMANSRAYTPFAGWMPLVQAGNQWSREIQVPIGLIPDTYSSSWYEFYFVATDGRGRQATSQNFSKLLTLVRSCGPK